MNFSIAAADGQDDSTDDLLAARGPDPLVRIPDPHVFRRTSGLPWVPAAAGALVPVADCLSLSLVEAMLAPTLRLVQPVSGAVSSRSILRSGIRLAAYDRALSQLESEPEGTGLNPQSTYENASHLATSIKEAVARLDPNNINPAYALRPQDVYPLQPPHPASPPFWTAMLDGPSSLTFNHLAEAHGFLCELGFIYFLCLGRSLTDTRDLPTAPARSVTQQLEAMCKAQGLSASNAPISATSILSWLLATQLPHNLTLLHEMGTGLDRREQNLRDRDALCFGSPDRKRSVISQIVHRAPLRLMVPNISSLLASATEGDTAAALSRLTRGLTGSSSAQVVDLAAVQTLESLLGPLLHCIATPALRHANLSRRVDEILRVKSLLPNTNSSGSGDTVPTGGHQPSSISRSLAAVYNEDVLAVISSPAWQAVESELTQEMTLVPIRGVRLAQIIMNGPLLGARKLALGQREASLLSVLQLSKPLQKSLNFLKDWVSLVSLALVCDKTTFTVTSPELLAFRLDKRTVDRLRRGDLEEINWVDDILVPTQIARAPRLASPAYPQGLLDHRVPPALEPLLERLSQLFGWPLDPPAIQPPLPNFASLPIIFATVATEHQDIATNPSPLDGSYLQSLREFVSLACREAATIIKTMLADDNPAGPLPRSLLPDHSAAIGKLTRFQNNRTARMAEANETPELYDLLTSWPSLKTRLLRKEVSFRAQGSLSDDETHYGPRLAPCVPGSRYSELVVHSDDGQTFWFRRPSTGERVSPRYDYATLEGIARRSRAELDFPFLLSTKSLQTRMEICPHSHLPGHRDENATAHKVPFPAFLDVVRRKFAHDQPSLSEPKPYSSRNLRSPAPGDRPSSFQDRDTPLATAEQGTSPATSREGSRPPSPRVAAEIRARNDKRRSSSREPSPSRRPHPRSPRADHPATPSRRGAPVSAEQAARWVAGITAASQARPTNAAPTQDSPPPRHGPFPTTLVPTQALVSVVAPSLALVRTLLLLVAVAPGLPAMVLLPRPPDAMLGMEHATLSRRGSAVQHARDMLLRLAIQGVDPASILLPVGETLPGASLHDVSTDRLVALPMGSVLNVGHSQASISSSDNTELHWVTIAALAGTAAYCLAAVAISRVRSFLPSVPRRSFAALMETPALMRTGARPTKRVKTISPTPTTNLTWMQAKAATVAADESLRKLLLACQADNPEDEHLRAFADLIRPINEEEIPPRFRLDGGLPSYANPTLRLVPFSTRVHPPATKALPPQEPQPPPPPQFRPRSLRDLLTPSAFTRVTSWYCAFGGWMLDLAEASARDPNSEEIQHVLRQRPEPLVVERSGIVQEARGIVWDLRDGEPKPLDFCSPTGTHLNLNTVARWRNDWPDYPDAEIFSHLIDGVNFKVDPAPVILLQPHLASLPLGIVSVHKELRRLVDQGFFQCFPQVPFVPWNTYPNGAALRKLEDRARRTTDGSAPRKGKNGARWLVDADGRRILSLNDLTVHPELEAGTSPLVWRTWENLVLNNPRMPWHSPPPSRVASPTPDTTPTGNTTPSQRNVLYLFSGPNEKPHSLATLLRNRGVRVTQVDKCVGGAAHDLSIQQVCTTYLNELENGSVDFLLISPPCKSFSVAVDELRPCLRPRHAPWGGRDVPARWKRYLHHHNQLVRCVVDAITRADRLGIPWAVENPACRHDKSSPYYWAAFDNWASLWDLLALEGIATGPAARIPALEATFAACAFDAPHQKYTTFWTSTSAAAFSKHLHRRYCTHGNAAHPARAYGLDEENNSLSAQAAEYSPKLAQAIAQAVIESLPREGDVAKCPEQSKTSVSNHPLGAAHTTATLDIDITASGPHPRLASPFLLPRGRPKSTLRPLLAAVYQQWLDARTIPAGNTPTPLQVPKHMAYLTGDHAERELQRLLKDHGHRKRLHFVCAKHCDDRFCHGHALARLYDQLKDSTPPPPFPKEVKPAVTEIMNDLAILMHLSHVTGIPLYQLASDVKDFFNQHYLASSQLHKTGCITLDLDKLIQHAATLRDHDPDLCNVVEKVLGYGFACGSNIAQRTAHLLMFIWSYNMAKEAAPVIDELRRAHPRLADWIDSRRAALDPPGAALSSAAHVLFLQSRLWTACMYTDDSHFAILSAPLTVLGLRVWYRIHTELNLTMAIVLKHGLGQTITALGFRIHTGLGIIYVPEDKARRACAQIAKATNEELSLRDYYSLLGLLQSMMSVLGMRKADTYGLYAPFTGRLHVSPDDVLHLNDGIKDRLRAWASRLGECAGVPFHAAVAGAQKDVDLNAKAAFFLRSDASKTGTTLPGVGGCVGGAFWRYPDTQPLSHDELQLPIAVLEFVAAVGTLAAFAPELLPDALLVLEVDAMATAQTLTNDAAKSPLMQLVHSELRQLEFYKRCEHRLLVAHVHGDANVAADAVSRGYFNVFHALARQLNQRVEHRHPPPIVAQIMAKLTAHASLAKTSRGAHNNNMTGSPIAHTGLASRAPSVRATPLRNQMAASTPPQHSVLSNPSALAGPARACATLAPHAPRLQAPPAAPPPVRPPATTEATHSQQANPYSVATQPLSWPPPPPSRTTRAQHDTQPTVPPGTSQAVSPERARALATTTDASSRSPCARSPLAPDHRQVAERVAELLQADTSEFALRPTNYDLLSLCETLLDPVTAQPIASTEAMDSAWKHWSQWCALHNTTPWRTCKVNSETEQHREAILQAGFLSFCHQRQSLRPRAGRPEALPSSAVKVLARIRKLHRDLNFAMVDSALVTTQSRRMAIEYKARHSVRHMAPRRKEPFTRAILVDILLSTPPGYALGKQRMDWESTAGKSLCALICTLAQTGFRKGELCVSKKGEPLNMANCLTRASLMWKLRGQVHCDNPPSAYLDDPQPGDYAILVPSASKADQFAVVWGDKPIHIKPRRRDPLCAFSALAAVESHIKVPDGAKRDHIALFVTDNLEPFTSSGLDAILRYMLRRCMTAEQAALYSWHSARIFLATALLAAGATPPQIQALCRWQTDAALMIYARMNPEHYVSLIDRALEAQVTAANVRALREQIPPIDPENHEPPDVKSWMLDADPDEQQPQSLTTQPQAQGRHARPRSSSVRSKAAPNAKPKAKQRKRAGRDKPLRPSKTRSRKDPRQHTPAPTAAEPVSVGSLTHRFPDNLDTHVTYAMRPSTRRPPTDRMNDTTRPRIQALMLSITQDDDGTQRPADVAQCSCPLASGWFAAPRRCARPSVLADRCEDCTLTCKCECDGCANLLEDGRTRTCACGCANLINAATHVCTRHADPEAPNPLLCSMCQDGCSCHCADCKLFQRWAAAMKRPEDYELAATVLPTPYEAQRPSGTSIATWVPYCSLCDHYHDFTRDPCDRLLGIRPHTPWSTDPPGGCPLQLTAHADGCDCTRRMRDQAIKQQRVGARAAWRDKFGLPLANTAEVDRSADDNPTPSQTPPTFTLHMVVPRTPSITPPHPSSAASTHKAYHTAELLIVDSGAEEHLEGGPGPVGFTSLQRTQASIDAVTPNLIPCEGAGTHTMFVLGGPPRYDVIEVVRPAVYAATGATHSLFSVSAAWRDLRIRCSFDDRCVLTLASGTEVPFYNVNGRYVLPRWYVKEGASRASNILARHGQLAAWDNSEPHHYERFSVEPVAETAYYRVTHGAAANTPSHLFVQLHQARCRAQRRLAQVLPVTQFPRSSADEEASE